MALWVGPCGPTPAGDSTGSSAPEGSPAAAERVLLGARAARIQPPGHTEEITERKASLKQLFLLLRVAFMVFMVIGLVRMVRGGSMGAAAIEHLRRRELFLKPAPEPAPEVPTPETPE